MSLGDVLAEQAANAAKSSVVTALVGALVREAAALIGPDKVDLARGLVSHAAELVPVEVLRQFLDDEAVRRANAVADTAEDAKFGPK